MKSLTSAICLGVFLVLPSAAAAQSVFISEILVGNDRSYCDSFGDDPDWIELFNPSDTAVNLGGWYLTDDPKEIPHRWMFPPDVVIQPHSYLLVFVKNKKVENRTRTDGKNLHISNFRLDARKGEVIALLSSKDVEVHRIRFGKQSRDVSLGTSDRSEPAVPQKWPTPGAPNNGPKPPNRCP